MTQFKLCPNGHYYDETLKECPYCKRAEDQKLREVSNTIVCCPICGRFLEVGLKCPDCDVSCDWKYNENIDTECAYLLCNRAQIKAMWTSAIEVYNGWLRDYHNYFQAYLIDAPSDVCLIEERKWLAALHSRIVRSDWYCAMHAYIDAYAKKIIERHHCYKYGLSHLDEQVKKLSSFEGDDYNNIFWELKSAIIHQDYGLRWYTPQVLGRELCSHCDSILDSKEKTCPRCGLSRDWKYNDNIDKECAEWFPEFCTIGGPFPKSAPDEITELLHYLREQTLRTGIDNSEWYALMQMYINEYTFKIIERKQCYKYGLPDLDNNLAKVPTHHIFWRLKKAIIKKDYGLNWLTPQEKFEETRMSYLMRT